MPGQEHITPRRARPLGTIWWLQKRGLLRTDGFHTHDKDGNRLYSKAEVFADFNIPKRTGFRWLRAIPEPLRETAESEETSQRESRSPSPSPLPKRQCSDLSHYMRRTAHNPLIDNRRGRRVEFSVEDGKHIHHWLLDLPEADKWQGYRLPWPVAAAESGLEVTCCERVIRNQMRRSFRYHTCMSTLKEGLHDKAKRSRVRWVQRRLQQGKYDDKEWLKTGFSMDEVHFGFQPALTTKVHRRPEDRNEHWVVQPEDPREKSKKLRNARNTIKNKEYDIQGAEELEDENEQTLMHAVCAVGWNFRSKLYWYTIPSNKNGKMTADVLIPILRQLYSEIENHIGHKDFRLQVDSDSSHHSKKVMKWVADNDRQLIISPGLSPDLNWIETNVRRVKYHVKNTAHLTTGDLEQIIHEGWRKVAQKKLNDDVLSQKERLEQVLLAGGERIHY